MKKSQLVEMIRKIVAEEVRAQLPNVVSEMYLKKLVSEQATPETSWEDSFDAELQRRTETVPTMMQNTDDGIYQKGGPIRRKNEAVRNKLLGGDNDMSFLYEGTKPIAAQAPGAAAQAPGAAAQAPVTDIPLEALGLKPKMYNASHFSKPSSQAPMKQSAASEERRLEQLRASLDVKA